MAFSAPQMAGDQLNPADIGGHTLVVVPVEYRAHVPTIHTKAGEESPCIVVNVADLSAEGGVPVIYRGAMWFNVMLINGLRRQIGETVLGRMQKGTAQTGKNPPWQLVDILANPAEAAWVQYGSDWIAKEDGVAFELESQRAAQLYLASAGATTPAASAPAAAPVAPPAPPAPPTVNAPPAAPPTTPAPPAAPPAGPPAANVGGSVSAPTGDLASQLAAMGETERAALMAVLGNQGQAAH